MHLFELFLGQIKVNFLIKFSGTSPSDHYYIIHFLKTTYRDVLGLVKNMFSQKFNKIREFDPT